MDFSTAEAAHSRSVRLKDFLATAVKAETLDLKRFDPSVEELPAYIFDVADLEKLTEAIVYVLLENDEVIYVGASQRGLVRPLNPYHHINITNRSEKNCRLIVFSCRDWKHALKVETNLVLRWRPKLNKLGHYKAYKKIV